jgi:hypothetical protein
MKTVRYRIVGDGYEATEDCAYQSARYRKSVTVRAGMYSDGATGALDVDSDAWWYHDVLCRYGRWDDGTRCTNWQASTVAARHPQAGRILVPSPILADRHLAVRRRRNKKRRDILMKERMNILDEFIAYLYEQLDNRSIYVWGAQGQKAPTVNETWIRARETSEHNALRAIAFWRRSVAAGYGDKLRAFDCSGLAMYWLQDLKALYTTDITADTLYRKKCGLKLRREEVRRGDWCFVQGTSGAMVHIGYVVDEFGTVIEARGRDSGVTLSSVSGSRWTHFARPDVFAELIDGAAPSVTASEETPIVLAITQPLMRGEGIKALQNALGLLGYDCGDVDGICGPATMAGINAFSEAHSQRLL